MDAFDTYSPLLATMFAAGLASGLHCVAMCGGIVTAFDAGSRAVIPIRPAGTAGASLRRLAFNAGRIATYATAGALVSAFGTALFAAGILPAQQALGIAAALMMLLTGLYLLGLGRILAPLEALGAPAWRRLMPLAARSLPARTPLRAFAAGLLWGFLPCAMVYGALAVAAFAGNFGRAALAMAAFGLGTLPFLLAAGSLAARLRPWRSSAGALLLGFGVYGIANATPLAEGIRRGILCL